MESQKKPIDNLRVISPNSVEDVASSQFVNGIDTAAPLHATHTGAFPVGDITVECAVLEDGTRLLTQRGVFVSLDRHKNPTKGQASIDNMPAFVSARNLQPFISDELRRAWTMVPFLSRGGYKGNIAFGYRAEILPLVCHVYLDADRAGALYKSQKRIAERCYVLNRAFSIIGIVTLIDEATGYQEIRERDELQKILKAYLAPQFLPWTKYFTDDFYEEMFRLWGWQYRPLSVNRPKYVAKLTSRLVYEKLPPGVVEEIREKNPYRETGRRERKNHQHLSEDIGRPHLEKQLAVVTALMRISPNRRAFERNFERAFPSTPLQPRLLPDPDEEDLDER